ncbi:MAG: tetratricopeptide repeat protein [Acidimicrobiia bacterium]
MSELPTGTVTFVFTDIEGSTSMLQRLGDAYVEVLEDHNRLLRTAFAAGTEVSTEGDALFFVFPSAPDALRAVVDAQRELAAFKWPEGGSVRVRMGMHTGEGLLGGDNYVGLDVHRAARIAAAGHGGQILLSDVTKVLASSAVSAQVTLRDIGEHQLKDIDQPEHLHQVVIRGLPTEFPPIRSLDSAPNNLPAQPTTFVGRDREIREITQLLEGARLVTLTGPGGSGKTRLAVQVASDQVEHYPDGVFYVPLESIRGSDLVLPTIADQLGVVENGGDSPLEPVVARLQDGTTLLLLDNFEHVLDAASDIALLLAQAADASVLVTSQTPLRLRGEQIYPIPPMASGESVELFAELVSSSDPSFELTDENRGVVEDVVIRLEGMPLAFELTAPRVQLFGLAGLRDRLVEQLDIAGTGFADMPERHRTLNNAIAWSYDLLAAAEKSLLRQLSVFDGGFILEAAEAVAAPEPTTGVVEGVASLMDKSMLRHEVNRGEARFSMLEAIRQFAMEALIETGDYDRTAQRHGEYFAHLAEIARPALGGRDQQAWLNRLAAEHDNIRAVLRFSRDTGKPDLGLRTAGSVWRFFYRRGHLSEARMWLGLLLDLPGASPLARAEGIDGLAAIAYWQRDFSEALHLYTELLDLFRSLDDELRVADTLYGLSTTYGQLGDQDNALAFADKVRAAYEKAGSSDGVGRVLGARAFSAWQSAQLEESVELEESLELWNEARAHSEAMGDRAETLQTDIAIAAVNYQLGRTEIAIVGVLEALEGMVALEDVSGTIMALDFLAAITAGSVPEPAVRLAGASHQLVAEAGGGLVAEAVGLEPAQSVSAVRMEAASLEAAWAEGGEMSLGEAVEYGREVGTAALHEVKGAASS